MAVTICDILKLPCMRGAAVLGGHAGLQKTVSTVSVLEYTVPDEVQNDLLNSIQFVGSELVLTCFASIRDDVDAQCDVICRIAEVGEVGLVLYYVGTILSKVDPKVIAVADRLDFPLICMPQGLHNLRYSEVISEVMESVIKGQMRETDFKSEIMGRLSALPIYQRSVGTVLAMLSDRVKTTILLTDTDGNLLNQAYWPRNIEPDADLFISLCRAGKYDELKKDRIYARREYINTAASSSLELLLLKYDEAIADFVAEQITEVVKICLNLWSQSYGEHVLPELVQAILKDEPFKMRRIAETFKIDVKSMNTMLVITPAGISPEHRKIASTAISLAKAEFSPCCKSFVADMYEGGVVAFMSAPLALGMPDLAESLDSALVGMGIHATIMYYVNMRDTKQVRRAYLMEQASKETAMCIYPGKRVFTFADIEFASQIRTLILQGEEAAKNSMEVLDALYEGPRLSAELTDTLSVYLLDANSSLERCAKKMFLHLNTIKYRINKISELLQFKVGRMPETLSLYTAVAVKRALQAAADK
ncbi:MAG: PucR family transcriptional regulator ligand-binding domain-containing protein [Clostridiales bacterium]|jgi:DNA-binding PucR family transcriptional regulator|nr:PucR family transcriptional regulator ligand-binding domain-containing protein [Clostridiales bacterium]